MGAAGFNKKFGAVKTFGMAQGFKFGKAGGAFAAGGAAGAAGKKAGFAKAGGAAGAAGFKKGKSRWSNWTIDWILSWFNHSLVDQSTGGKKGGAAAGFAKGGKFGKAAAGTKFAKGGAMGAKFAAKKAVGGGKKVIG